jgi:hypothetical protein
MVVGMQRKSGLRTALASVGTVWRGRRGQRRGWEREARRSSADALDVEVAELFSCGDRGAVVGGPGHPGFSAQIGDGERAVGGTHGLAMVDAGISWEQAHDHDRYYGSNLLARLLNDRDEYLLAPAQELEVQLARLGTSRARSRPCS